MGFFDEYDRFLSTSIVGATANRLNKRHQAIIDHNRDVIEGARVLDLASHDGRWSFAAIKAGAEHLTGIEARPELTQRANESFRAYGIPSDRYRFVQGDALESLRSMAIEVDTVLLLGYLYHTGHHLELVRLIESTGARAVIVDTRIMEDSRVRPEAPVVVELLREGGSANPGNQVLEARHGTDQAVVGHPSRQAVPFLFDYFGYDAEEYDWGPMLAAGPLDNVEDYAENRRITLRMIRRPS